MKKNLLRVCALLMLVLMLLMTAGCGAGKYFIGTWNDSTGNITLEFHKDGSCIATMYSMPLPVTYTYEGTTLTLIYSEDITDAGQVTFFGDNEFVWDKVDDETGEAYQEYYTRDTSAN